MCLLLEIFSVLKPYDCLYKQQHLYHECNYLRCRKPNLCLYELNWIQGCQIDGNWDLERARYHYLRQIRSGLKAEGISFKDRDFWSPWILVKRENFKMIRTLGI